jgi:cardiolipin synthase
MGNLLGPPILGGNQTTTLLNGNQIFPPMLEAIRSAKKNINFETFVYWSGQLGAEFATALSDKARQGVKVHVIIDTIGSNRIDSKYVKQMTDSGVELVKYHPLHWWEIGYDVGFAEDKINNRTHRKLLIVDGEVGFTGGAGIADEWIGDADSPDHWRDTHYMIKGPAVAQLQSAFVDNWMETTGRVLHGEDYFPPLPDAGQQWAQVFKSGPQGGSESMELMFLLSIAAAEKNIRLGSAYFVPDDLTRQALIDARKRGVSVQIIVPGPRIDVKIVRRASRARWGELLNAGVEIDEYQPTMYHCKLMIVDDRWVSIGSANLDNLSFRTNDEANLNVLDPPFAAEQIRIFDEDLQHARRISYEEWRGRPFGEKLMESTATMFGWLM